MLDENSIALQLDRAGQWVGHINPLLHSLTCESARPPRLVLTTAFHHLALEHYAGIAQLVRNGQYSPAFALYRPQMDAFVRGAWFRVCASEAEVAQFLAAKLEPAGTGKLVHDLEQKKAFEPGLLKKAKANIYEHLCDLTHGGAGQVLARLRGDEIQTRFTDEHVCGLLFSTGTLSLLSLMDIARAHEDWELFEQASQVHKGIFGWEG